MVELLEYVSLKDKHHFLSEVDLSEASLVVPDLSSKMSWQEHLLKRDKHILGPQILRAEDLWKSILLLVKPEIEFVSRSWMTAFLKQLTSGDTSDFSVSANTLFKSINEFLPILAHPDSIEVMNNWFKTVQKDQSSWRPWFELSVEAWNEISKKASILQEWSPCFLAQTSNFESYWTRDLIVDLGPELRPIEVELFQALAQKCRVQILVPKLPWSKEFPWISYPYQQFLQRSHQIISIENKINFVDSTNTNTNTNSNADRMPYASAESSTHFVRFPSFLGEVKYAIEQIENWRKQGFDFSQMALIAPDIEAYWPVLSAHLRMADFPFEKAEKAKVGSIGSVVTWLEFLKNKVTLQVPLPTAAQELNIEAGLVVNPNPSGDESLVLVQESTFTSVFTSTSKHTASHFLEWTLSVTPLSELLPQSVTELCQKWLYEAESHGQFSASQWLEYLSDYLNSLEYESFDSCHGSIGIYSLMSGIPLYKNLHFIFGCSESQLKSHRGLVSGADVLSLQFHTGHLLAHPDRDFREFQLRCLWGLGREQYFSFPETDFAGSELVPSIFWMKGEGQQRVDGIQSITERKMGRNLGSDQIKDQKGGQAADQTADHEADRAKGIAKNLYEVQGSEFIHHDIAFSLSPASLKLYLECPFKFFAEKGLKLKDPILADLELDPRTQGSLQHQLLEWLLVEPFDASLQRTKISETIDKVLETQKEFFYSDKTKNIVKQHLLDLAQRFLDNEESARREFPRFYTLAREAWFQKNIDANGKKIKFRGKIDRIDFSTDNQAAIVIDYKSDVKSYSHAGSWIKNLEIQMPSYIMGVESGSAITSDGKPIPATSVIAAHYYGLRDFNRKGFTLDTAEPGIVTSLSSSGTISMEEKQKLIDEFQELLIQSAQKISEGDFRAIPHPKTNCQTCSWRNICRTTQPNL